MLLLTFSSLNILQQVEELLALQLLQLTPQDLQLNAVLQVKIVETSSGIISLQKCSGQTQSVSRELRIVLLFLGKSALQMLDFSLTSLNLRSLAWQGYHSSSQRANNGQVFTHQQKR